MRDSNLIGGLPFPDMAGRRRAARPLQASATALTLKQALSESQHQQQLFTWLRFWAPRVPEFDRTYHVANEHNGNVVTRVKRSGQVVRYCPSGARRKAEGVKAGMFDLANHALSRALWQPFDPDPLDYRCVLSGLFIDLKVREAELTDDPKAEWDQVRELAWLRSQNKSAHVCWSWAEVAALHSWYFDVGRRDVWQSIGPLGIYLLPKLGGHDQRCGCGLQLSEVLRRHE